MSVLDKLKRVLRRDRDDGEGRGNGGREVADRRIDAVGDLPTSYLPKGGYDEGRPPR